MFKTIARIMSVMISVLGIIFVILTWTTRFKDIGTSIFVTILCIYIIIGNPIVVWLLTKGKISL